MIKADHQCLLWGSDFTYLLRLGVVVYGGEDGDAEKDERRHC